MSVSALRQKQCQLQPFLVSKIPARRTASSDAIFVARETLDGLIARANSLPKSGDPAHYLPTQ
jgi:hypothetical protein